MRKCSIAFVVDRLGVQDILSIPLLSALAKERGHAARLFEFDRNPRKACAEIAAFDPDIVAYSLCSNEVDEYLRINRTLKKRLEFFSLFGGAHPTFFPEFVESDGVDAICRGEADRCFPEFLDRFGTEEMYTVDNLVFKAPDGQYRRNPVGHLVEDLDTLPFPDRNQLYAVSYFMARNPIKTFMAGRGCPYRCSYCFNHAFHEIYRGKGKMVRTKSVGYLLDEIREVSRKYPLNFVRFLDDIFGLDRAWLAEFATRYPATVGLPFACFARPNMITAEYARLLIEAGCYSVYMAIECADEQRRRSVANRNVTNEQILAAGEHLKREGIRMATFNMVGLPGETERDIMETVALNRRIGADFAEVSILQPYPGTPVNEYCRAHGYLDEKAGSFESFYTASVLKGAPDFKNRIFVLHKMFTVLVDHPWLRALLRPLYRMRFLNGVLNLFYRFYYGRHMHGRIYGGRIPLTLRLRAALDFFVSKSRA